MNALLRSGCWSPAGISLRQKFASSVGACLRPGGLSTCLDDGITTFIPNSNMLFMNLRRSVSSSSSTSTTRATTNGERVSYFAPLPRALVVIKGKGNVLSCYRVFVVSQLLMNRWNTADTVKFLQNLITNDIKLLTEQRLPSMYTALLNAQVSKLFISSYRTLVLIFLFLLHRSITTGKSRIRCVYADGSRPCQPGR